MACGVCKEGGFQQKISKPELRLSRGLLITTISMSTYQTTLSAVR